MQRRQDTAQGGPARPQGTEQHPANRRARQAAAQPDADDRLATEHLPQREDQSLSGWILGGIGGLLKHVHGFEMNPERVGRIGETALGESVCLKQIAEFVMNQRLWNLTKKCERDINHQGAQAADHDAQAPLPTNPAERPLYKSEQPAERGRRAKTEQQQHEGKKRVQHALEV